MKNNDVLIQKIVFDLDIDTSDNYQLFFEIINLPISYNPATCRVVKLI